MSKISYSAMAGDLKKAARLYEVFKTAAESAEVLAKLEKHTRDLEGQEKALEKVLDKLNSECDKSEERQRSIEAHNAELLEEGKKIIEKTKDEASAYKAKVESELDYLKDKTNQELALVEAKIADRKKELADLDAQCARSKKAADKAESDLESLKSKILAVG